VFIHSEAYYLCTATTWIVGFFIENGIIMDDKIKSYAEMIGIVIRTINHTRNIWHRAEVADRKQNNQDATYISSEEFDPILKTSKIIFTFHNHVTNQKLSKLINENSTIKYSNIQIEKIIQRREQQLQEQLEKKQQILEFWQNTYKEISPLSYNHLYLDNKRMFLQINSIKTAPMKIYHRDSDFSGYIHTNVLMYPFYDDDNNIKAFQTIYYYNSICYKRYRGSISGLYFMLGAVTEKTKFLIIGEGLATVWAVWHLRPEEYCGIVVGDAGNLEKIIPPLYNKYSKLMLVILADNDYANENNVGMFKTQQILEKYRPSVSIDGKLINERRIFRIIPEVFDGKNSDWWDVWAKKGSKFIINIIDGYSSLMTMSNAYGIYRDELVNYRVELSDKDDNSNKDTPSGEFVADSGHIIKYTRIGFPILVCSTIEGGADLPIKTSSSYMILKKQELHQSYVGVKIERTSLLNWQSFKKELLRVYWDAGSITKKGESIMYDIVSTMKPMSVYIPVRPGWLLNIHRFGLSNQVTDNKIVVPYDTNSDAQILSVHSSGSLISWKKYIGATVDKVFIARIIYLIFGYAPIVKFATSSYNPLLMLKVNSGYGKTLLGKCLMSMIGNPENLRIQNATGAAGMENLFADFNDLPIFLDELTNFDKEALRVLAYLYGNGRGKARGTVVAGVSQEVMKWRGCAYATSEKTLSELREDNELPKENAGEEIRVLNLALENIIETDRGILFSERTKSGDYKLFTGDDAKLIGSNLLKYYGKPLVHYVDYLEKKGEEYIRTKIAEISSAFYEKHKSSIETGQHTRVLGLLSEMLAGLHLVIEADICSMTIDEAEELVLLVYNRWLANSIEKLENTSPLIALISFIKKQLSNAHKLVDNSPYSRSGWDGVVINGEFKSGTVPLILDNKTPVGVITEKDRAGRNVVILFSKWVNAIMNKTNTPSNMNKSNLQLLQKEQGLVLEVCDRQNRMITPHPAKQTWEDMPKLQTGIKLDLFTLLEMSRRYGI
jgi:hypothetical protein